MFLPRRYENERPTLNGVSCAAVEEKTFALRHDIDLVPRVRSLTIAATRPIESASREACAKIGTARLPGGGSPAANAALRLTTIALLDNADPLYGGA